MNKKNANLKISPTIIFSLIICAISGFFTAYFGIKSEQAWIGIIFNLFLAWPIWQGTKNLLGRSQALILIITISLLSLLIESLALASCLPYGCFSYTPNIGPQISITIANQDFLLAPWSLPLAFLPILFGAYGAATLLHQKIFSAPALPLHKSLSRIFFSLLILIGLDLLIDPLAVKLHLWQYQNSAGWFNVPWSNFAGWILSGTIFLIITEKHLKGKYSQHYSLSLSLLLSFWLSAGITLISK